MSNLLYDLSLNCLTIEGSWQIYLHETIPLSTFRPWLSFRFGQMGFYFFVTFVGKSNCHFITCIQWCVLWVVRKRFVRGWIYICKGRIVKIRLKKVHTVPSSIIKFSRKIGRDISPLSLNYANQLLSSLNVRWKHGNVCLNVLKIVTFTDMVV